jgi:hypothetical protein
MARHADQTLIALASTHKFLLGANLVLLGTMAIDYWFTSVPYAPFMSYLFLVLINSYGLWEHRTRIHAAWEKDRLELVEANEAPKRLADNERLSRHRLDERWDRMIEAERQRKAAEPKQPRVFD